MNQKVYNRIVVACTIIAMVSALGYDKFPLLSPIFMALAVLSAIVAIAAYFINHYRNDNNKP